MVWHGRRSFILALTAFLMAMFMANTSQAAVYFLSPDGDDDNRGTRNQPWRSVERANEAVQPGDTVVFMPGEYEGTIRPATSGRRGSPITYVSMERWAATLSPEGDGPAIRMHDRKHIVIDGLTVDGQSRAPWLRVTDSRHIEVRNCRMRNADGPHGVLEFQYCEQIRVVDNLLSADRVSGNMIHFRDSEYMLLEGNSLTRIGHSPIQISVCENVVVRANVFRNDWGRNYEFWATGRILVEDNIITQNRDSARSADSRAKNLFHEAIYRHNRIYDNRHTPLNSRSYFPASADASITGHYREPFRTVNSRIYNNTIADNLGHGWEIGGMNVSSNLFQNNIFYRNDWAGGNVQFTRDLVAGQQVAADNRLVKNLFRGTEPGQRVIRYEGEYWTVQEANNNTRLWRGIWSEFDENIDADPAFVNRDNYDYRLSSASEAIDAGRPLTVVLRDGEGDVVPVSDGVPFFDGFGIEGEQGDWIMIGEGDDRQLAQIERVELRHYVANRLHLDREVRFREGDPVNLPWDGSAPDIGAYQREVTGPYDIAAFASPARRAEPGEPVQFELATTDGASLRSVRWDFEDGHVSEEREPTHVFKEAGDYGVTVRVVFADGTRAVTPVFVKVREPDTPTGPLVEVDFEEDTRGEDWGYLFKFYRGWLTGYEHVDREDGQGKAMRLYYADKANRAAGALAPGAWTIEDYPYIRFSYRIKPGTPVAICVEPFEAPDRPAGFLLGGTDNRATGDYIDLDQYELIADGQWHEITVDLRHIHDELPELEHLYRFMFYTQWDEDEGQEFWFDDFAILPAEGE